MSDEALNNHLDWLDKCAEEHANEPSKTPHVEIEMTWEKWKDLLEYIAKLEATNTNLLEALKAVRDWVGPNLAQLSRKEAIEIMEQALRKAKSHAGALKGE